MASVKLFNKLTGVSKLWTFYLSSTTDVNASLLLSGRVEVLEDSFSRASRASEREWGGMGWHLVCTNGAGSSSTMQLAGGLRETQLVLRRATPSPAEVTLLWKRWSCDVPGGA